MENIAALRILRGANQLTPVNDAQTGADSNDAPETINVYLGEPYGTPSGVLLYYAVLAYPRRHERRKRREFIEAMAAMRFREFLVQGTKRKEIPLDYRRYKPEKMLCRISLGWKRIDFRVHAAIIAWCIYLNEKAFRFSEPTPDGKVGIVFRGPATVKVAIRAYLADKQKILGGLNLEEESAMANIAHRVWAESFPVLHIAMQNPTTIKIVEALMAAERPTSQQIGKALFDSVHDPSWLRKAVEYAENLKPALPQMLGTNPSDPRGLGYKAEKAISLLPTDNPALAYRL